MEPKTPDWLSLDEPEFEESFQPAGGVTPPYLHKVLVRALKGTVTEVPDERALSRKPVVLGLHLPLPPRLRFYLSQVTTHASERQPGACKIQLTCGIPVPTRGASSTTVDPRSRRRRFDRSDGVRPVLLGYHLTWKVFVLWDADLHDLGAGFPYSKSVQVHSDLIAKAAARGLAQTTRKLHGEQLVESIIAVRPYRLHEALDLRIKLSNEAMPEGLF